MTYESPEEARAELDRFETAHQGHQVETTTTRDPNSNYLDYTCHDCAVTFRAWFKREL